MPVTVVEIEQFAHQADRLMTESERAALIDFVAHNPVAGDLIPGAGGVRKIRWAILGKGKRGGLRAIYYFQDENWPILMVGVYAKSEKENLSAAERNKMRVLVAAIKHARRLS